MTKEKNILEDFGIQIGIVGIIIGVLGLAIAIYSFYETNKTREPLVFYDNQPVKILNVNALGEIPLKIMTSENKLIDEDLYVASFGFGNVGKESIKRENVLKDITFTMSNDSVNILDCSLTKSTRNVVNASIESIDDEMDRYKLNFDILEEGDGVEIQILYTGSEDVNMVFEGVVEGNRNFKLKKSKSETGIATLAGPKKNFSYFKIEDVFNFEK